MALLEFWTGSTPPDTTPISETQLRDALARRRLVAVAISDYMSWRSCDFDLPPPQIPAADELYGFTGGPLTVGEDANDEPAVTGRVNRVIEDLMAGRIGGHHLDQLDKAAKQLIRERALHRATRALRS